MTVTVVAVVGKVGSVVVEIAPVEVVVSIEVGVVEVVAVDVDGPVVVVVVVVDELVVVVEVPAGVLDVVLVKVVGSPGVAPLAAGPQAAPVRGMIATAIHVATLLLSTCTLGSYGLDRPGFGHVALDRAGTARRPVR